MMNLLINNASGRKMSAIAAAFLLLASASVATAQTVKWMNVGSVHNWYSGAGNEIEVGRYSGAGQQDGLRWPAIYNYMDMQAAKGFWIGTTNYQDPVNNSLYSYKAVHVGPRVRGNAEFYPMQMKMISKFDPPSTFVNSNMSQNTPVENDAVDATLPADRIIDNIVNTAIGLTMQRKIIGFSQQGHDNYIIYDYTFTNTGVIDDKGKMRDTVTLTGVYFYWQYRYAPCWDTRYVIGNGTGWGMNTMLDATGDTTLASTFFGSEPFQYVGNDIRAQYAWHGKFPAFTTYDNVGGPIWLGYYDTKDTVGRIGAYQFCGIATLHADKSWNDTTDDKAQPRTTSYVGSDDILTSGNDQFNGAKNGMEYAWMTAGHQYPRHADYIGPTGDPAKGTPGGYSFANGYGPYNIPHGKSIRIVMVEAVAGLGREAGIEIGKVYKRSGGNNTLLIPYNGTSKTKNNWVYTGRDSLYKTFRNALNNYSSGYTLSQRAPYPPKIFNVNSGAGRINLDWQPSAGGPAVAKYQVWRAIGRYDSTYYKIWESPDASARSFSDTSADYDKAYYYYLIIVGTNGVQTSRYYTQAYDPAYRRVSASPTLVKDQIRIVPNPYNIGADPSRLLYPGEKDKISFKNIPSTCTIKIYSELGEIIKTIDHNDGTSSQDYDMTTSSQQIIVSGVYIAVIETPQGERSIHKFVVIR